MWCSPKMGVKKCVFGFPSEMHCRLRHEGKIQLKPDMCRTVWREHDLLRGGWPQTEFAVLFGANIFMQKRHVGSESGGAIYLGSKENSGSFGAKCSFWCFCPICLFRRVQAFLACGQESHEFLLQTKHSTTCLRKMTAHVLYSLS